MEKIISKISSINSSRKGIILAGGLGSRLSPITKVISKQLLPVYDKPMIYYPISTLMLSGIRDILIITTEHDNFLFKELLGDGSKWGLSLRYEIQSKPNGLAEAFIIGKEFIGNSKCALILGDNLFHGNELINQLHKQNRESEGATVFAYPVSNPKDYAVVQFDKQGKVKCIEEKPKDPKSNFALTGLYFYDETVVDRAKEVKPSPRGELEITDLNNSYLRSDLLKVEKMGRGMAWLDTGSYDSLNDASVYIKTLEHRQGLKVGCPEEIAFRFSWITANELEKLSKPLIKSGYGKYLMSILRES